MTMDDQMEELARLGSSTVYEADGQASQVDADFIRIVPGSRAAGPARTVVCGQEDNLMVHAAMAELQEGEVLVLTMPEARPHTLLGDLLATQAKVRGAAAILVDGAVRDVDELAELGLPIWARWVRPKGPAKKVVGELDVPVVVGGATIRPGDILVLDGDGIAVVDPARRDHALQAALEREQREAVKREKLLAGHLSYDLDGLRAVVEGVKA
jgi:4-hydroxy-4-methyl-2-oxoglutarate aldolase